MQQKTKQVKDSATGSLDSPKSVIQSGKPAFALLGGKMTEKKTTDNRCRRYIRINDAESWRMIDEISNDDGYKNSFNKIINDALFYGLPILREKVVGGMVTEEEKSLLVKSRTSGSETERFYAVLTGLLKENVLSETINKSIISSLFNLISEAYADQGDLINRFNRGMLADTPAYLEQFEAEGIKNLRK